MWRQVLGTKGSSSESEILIKHEKIVFWLHHINLQHTLQTLASIGDGVLWGNFPPDFKTWDGFLGSPYWCFWVLLGALYHRRLPRKTPKEIAPPLGKAIVGTHICKQTKIMAKTAKHCHCCPSLLLKWEQTLWLMSFAVSVKNFSQRKFKWGIIWRPLKAPPANPRT